MSKTEKHQTLKTTRSCLKFDGRGNYVGDCIHCGGKITGLKKSKTCFHCLILHEIGEVERAELNSHGLKYRLKCQACSAWFSCGRRVRKCVWCVAFSTFESKRKFHAAGNPTTQARLKSKLMKMKVVNHRSLQGLHEVKFVKVFDAIVSGQVLLMKTW